MSAKDKDFFVSIGVNGVYVVACLIFEPLNRS